MSPRDLSNASVLQRLRLMRELLEALGGLGDLTREVLESDVVQRLAIERILTQLVDLAADINQHVASTRTDRAPSDYRASFDAVAGLGMIPFELAGALKPSVGLRNVLVHQYVNIDFGIVAAAIPLAREQYAAYGGLRRTGWHAMGKLVGARVDGTGLAHLWRVGHAILTLHEAVTVDPDVLVVAARRTPVAVSLKLSRGIGWRVDVSDK